MLKTKEACFPLGLGDGQQALQLQDVNQLDQNEKQLPQRTRQNSIHSWSPRNQRDAFDNFASILSEDTEKAKVEKENQKKMKKKVSKKTRSTLEPNIKNSLALFKSKEMMYQMKQSGH